ncbi:MAG TPA: radical SAM protein [Elusimicrobiota bacterium]|nr:radical SAM protein [Elusimicrobiota bacterium]
MSLEQLSAPAMVTWQMTRDCNLACLHCCTESAPGKALPGELSREESLRLAGQIVAAGVPYVMLVGGEPTIVSHFLEVAQTLGRGGVFLKIETNGQKFGENLARSLSELPIRSIQISLDGATQGTYGKMRPGGKLDAALAAGRMARRFNLPLEITFAPTRLNIHEAAAVIDLALELGAFRFNTGRLMRVGTAAKLWERLELSEETYADYYRLLERREKDLSGSIELCFRPFSLAEQADELLQSPPAALLILPDGRVKMAAASPYYCADLKTGSLMDAWQAYRSAWLHPLIRRRLEKVLHDDKEYSRANEWIALPHDLPVLNGLTGS